MNIIPTKRSYRYHLFFLCTLFVLYTLHLTSQETLFIQASWMIPLLFISLFFSLYHLLHPSFHTLRLFFLTSIFSFFALLHEPFAYPVESLILIAFAMISLWLHANIFDSKKIV